jgi:hypothetical protein
MSSPHVLASPPAIVGRPVGHRLTPLAFTLPGGTARLVRWLVSPGQPFERGAPLARVRISVGTVWDLVAQGAGVLDDVLVPSGREVHSGEWLALVRPG